MRYFPNFRQRYKTEAFIGRLTDNGYYYVPKMHGWGNRFYRCGKYETLYLRNSDSVLKIYQ